MIGMVTVSTDVEVFEKILDSTMSNQDYNSEEFPGCSNTTRVNQYDLCYYAFEDYNGSISNN